MISGKRSGDINFLGITQFKQNFLGILESGNFLGNRQISNFLDIRVQIQNAVCGFIEARIFGRSHCKRFYVENYQLEGTYSHMWKTKLKVN